MYSPSMTIPAPGIGTPANGTIRVIDISLPPTNIVLCDITTPWGDLYDSVPLDEGECKRYVKYISTPLKEYVYIIKVLSIDQISIPPTATFQVLSYAFDGSLLIDGSLNNQLIVADNLPTEARPGDIINYDFKITNYSTSHIYVRYILSRHLNGTNYPVINNCQSLPSTDYTKLNCWYDDWAVGTIACQDRILSPGAFIDVTGSTIISSSGVDAFTLGVFVRIDNYWASGKHEYVAPAGLQGGWGKSITVNPCAGILCTEPVCIYNPPYYDLYSQKCVDGTCVPDALIESNSILCSATHYLDVDIRPHSWYTPESAALQIVTKIIEIDGAISNVLADLIGFNWQYLGVRVITEVNRVIIRIYFRDMTLSLSPPNLSSSNIVSMAAPIIAIIEKIAIVAIIIGAIIIFVGIICAVYLVTTTLQKLFGKDYTKQEVGDLLNDVLDRIEQNCDINFPDDPVGYANCVKSGIQSVTGGGGDFFDDPKITDGGTKAAEEIDKCVVQYNIDQDKEKLDLCIKANATDPVKQTITEQTRQQPAGWGSILLLAGIGIAGILLLRKGPPSLVIRQEKE